jgi:hypothetical protein
MPLNVEITLFEENGRGPGMWFLGVPPTPKVALNCGSPGPVIVDFDALDEGEKRHILVSLNMRKIRTSVPYGDLLRNYAPAPEVAPVVEEFIKQDKIKQASRTVVEEIAAAHTAKAQKCTELTSLGIKVLRAEVEKMDDIQMVKMLRQLELQKPERKRRASILKALEAKVQEHQKQIVLEIEKSAESQPSMVPARYYGKLEVSYEKHVEETDQEIIQFAMGDALKVKETKK